MGKTSTAVKQRWNTANYDQIKFYVPKGEREKIAAYAKAKGETTSSLIKRLLDEEMNGSGMRGEDDDGNGIRSNSDVQ